MEDGFMAMIDGTKSVKDAFKEMAAAIIKELLYVMVVKKAVSAVTGFFGFADGGAFSGGSEVKAYADGGVVGGPTTFPMAGGKTGLMGEAGPEAIMPLKRGANGKLGVQMEGGSQGNVVINQSFNFQANGDDSVKKIIAQAAPQIAQMTKSSLLNDRRRGGATKAAFG
jgi:phage-related minor tail protein